MNKAPGPAMGSNIAGSAYANTKKRLTRRNPEAKP